MQHLALCRDLTPPMSLALHKKKRKKKFDWSTRRAQQRVRTERHGKGHGVLLGRVGFVRCLRCLARWHAARLERRCPRAAASGRVRRVVAHQKELSRSTSTQRRDGQEPSADFAWHRPGPGAVTARRQHVTLDSHSPPWGETSSYQTKPQARPSLPGFSGEGGAGICGRPSDLTSFVAQRSPARAVVTHRGAKRERQAS